MEVYFCVKREDHHGWIWYSGSWHTHFQSRIFFGSLLSIGCCLSMISILCTKVLGKGAYFSGVITVISAAIFWATQGTKKKNESRKMAPLNVSHRNQKWMRSCLTWERHGTTYSLPKLHLWACVITTGNWDDKAPTPSCISGWWT